ncbi:MAG: hypothetical protein WAM97_07385 [Acidimicrobiales bacterium]
MPDDSHLGHQLLAILEAGPEPVTAEEAMARVTVQRTPVVFNRQASRLPRRTAIAWLAIVIILVVVLVVGFRVAGKSTPTEVTPADRLSVAVDVSVTPAGWTPVDFGNLQLSVPSSWKISTTPSTTPGCPTTGGGIVVVSGIIGPACTTQTNSVSIDPVPDKVVTGGHLPGYGRPEMINGIKAYPIVGGADAPVAGHLWAVPSLGVDLTITGPLASRVLHTITYSPRAIALAVGPVAAIPASWRRIHFGGLGIAVPANWPTQEQPQWGSPTGIPSDVTFADLTTSFSPPAIDAKPAVVLDEGQYNPYDECANCWDPPAASAGWDTAPIDGLLVDDGGVGPLSGDPALGGCRSLSGTRVCVVESDRYAVLVLSVTYPGSKSVAVEIGLAGNGMVARTILDSIERSNAAATPPPTTPITVPPRSWTQRTILAAGSAQDVSPTEQALYWLDTTGSDPAAPVTNVTVVRYDRATHKVTRSAPITGVLGSTSVTVTGGWTWFVIGVGNNVVVEQLDPTTLETKKTVTLPAGADAQETPVSPLLTGTVNGPLWVGGNQELWALNPSDGTIETHFEAGTNVMSMSTDPAGSLLYIGGEPGTGPDASGLVAEYDADTGTRLAVTNTDGLGAPVVAATNGGVWVSERSGMAGQAFELSAKTLQSIAPLKVDNGFGIYNQIMGVGASVSGGVLWLENTTNGFTCADPSTGTVISTEPMPVYLSDPIGLDGVVYAFKGSNLVTITPPAACFK